MSGAEGFVALFEARRRAEPDRLFARFEGEPISFASLARRILSLARCAAGTLPEPALHRLPRSLRAHAEPAHHETQTLARPGRLLGSPAPRLTREASPRGALAL